MITLSNGHSFEYATAGGALGLDGNGWPWQQPLRWAGFIDPSIFTVTTKTLTRYPRESNRRRFNNFGYTRFLRGGVANAAELINPGIEWWREKIGLTIDSSKIPIVASIAGDPKELAEMAEMLNDFNLVALEINASQNSRECLTSDAQRVALASRWVKKVSRFPIILKISIAQDIEIIAKQAEGVIEAFSIGGVPWSVIFPNRESPFTHLGTEGEVSGRITQWHNWHLAARLARLSKIPVIGPDIWDYDDIAMIYEFGVKAVSFGSVFLRHPWRPTIFVKRKLKMARRKNGLE